MKLQAFLGGQRDLQRRQRVLTLTVALLALANLLAWWQRGRQDMAVVLTPPTLSQAAQVARNQADSAYKMAWGLFVAQLLGNVTPGSADLMLPALEPLLDAVLYQPVRLGVAEQLRQIRQEQISINFTPRVTQYDAVTDTIYITGRLTTAGLSGAPRVSERTYELRWRIDNYRPRLVHLDAYNGPPRTQKPSPPSSEVSP